MPLTNLKLNIISLLFSFQISILLLFLNVDGQTTTGNASENFKVLLNNTNLINGKGLLQPPLNFTLQKYLMLTSVDEGIGHHRKVVFHFCGQAKQTGRVLVEPCYQNGRLVQCRYHDIVYSLNDLQDNKMVPFSFYWNTTALSEICEMIPYQNFRSNARFDQTQVHFMNNKLYKDIPEEVDGIPVKSFSVIKKNKGIDVCTTPLCNNQTLLIIGRIRRHSIMAEYHQDVLATLFQPNQQTVVRYAKIFQEQFLTENFISFQWRSEHQALKHPEARKPCATALASIINSTEQLLKGNATNALKSSILLISDVVYPNSSVSGSLSHSARGAFQHLDEVGSLLQETGAVKLDAITEWIQDLGILALMDLQLAAWSEKFYPCTTGSFCRACAVDFWRFKNHEPFANSFTDMLTHARIKRLSAQRGLSPSTIPLKVSWIDAVRSNMSISSGAINRVKEISKKWKCH